MELLKNIVISMRPHHWTKNLLVFAGLIFSKSYTDPHAILLTVAAFIAFCLASSTIYLFNDFMDRKEDKFHPMKIKRPIAAGKLKPSLVITLISLLFLLSVTIAIGVNLEFFAIIAAYFLLNLGYSLGLKKIVILDAFIVSFGFLLRSLSGTVAIGVEASSWIMICTLFLAFILTFGKRRYELANLDDDATAHRTSLGLYTLQLLDALIIISSTAGIVTYALYTFDPKTIEHFGSNKLIYSVIFVAFGIFRYLFLIFNKNKGATPVNLLFTDKPLIINWFLWVFYILLTITIK